MFSDLIKDALLKVLKIDKADPAKQKEFLAAFEELVQQVIIKCIIDNLNNTDAKIFLDFIEKDKTGDKALSFAQSKIPNLENKITEAISQEITHLNY
ncbi:hypothetical protein FJY90_03620 [Candidatus Gottesmanbacteria bacterium]|nr:hypothetical protein [Candidatus Gottesmanbacteria bacterium]